LTHNAAPIVNDYGIDHDQSMKRLVGSSTRESRSTIRHPTMPWLQGCSSIRSPPHLPKDNEEVNVHVKRLWAMLDVAMIADPAHDQGDEYRGHDDDHRGSPRGDSASSITPLEGRGEDNHGLRDVICGRDACSQIES
jgi:hypothetical protein